MHANVRHSYKQEGFVLFTSLFKSKTSFFTKMINRSLRRIPSFPTKTLVFENLEAGPGKSELSEAQFIFGIFLK